MMFTSFKSIRLIPILSSFIFFIFSVVFYFLNLDGFLETLPSIINLFLILIFFISYCFKENIFSIYPWFYLSSGLFICFGSIGSYFRYNDNLEFLSKMVSISFANILNSFSLLIISIICFFLISKFKFEKEKIFKLLDLVKIYKKLMFLILFLIFTLNFYFHLNDIPSNYEQSLLSKLNIIKLGTILLVSLLISRERLFYKILFIVYMTLEVMFQITSFSKFLVLQVLFISFLGLWYNSKKKIFFGFIYSILLVVIFFSMTVIVTISRSHNLYHENKNDLLSKFLILKDVTIGTIDKSSQKNLNRNFTKKALTKFKNPKYYNKDFEKQISKVFVKIKKVQNPEELNKLINTLKENSVGNFDKLVDDIMQSYSTKYFNHQFKLKERVINFLNRLDVLSPQRYIIKEKLNGNSLESFKSFFYLFIPRIFWSDKPIITNNGEVLYNLFFHNNVDKENFKYQKSSLGPSIHIEAFWNFGSIGLIMMSLFIGVFLSICNNFFIYFKSKIYLLAYFIIFPSLVKIVLFYESWLIHFFGELIILIVMFSFLLLLTFVCKKTKFLVINAK